MCIITKSQCGYLPLFCASCSADVTSRDISGNKFLIVLPYCINIVLTDNSKRDKLLKDFILEF
jgi:hypothetical protein